MPVLYPVELDFLRNLIMAPHEAKSFQEAIQHTAWIEAMNLEFAALELNRTWDLVPLPKGKKPIRVYKLKLRADGTITNTKLDWLSEVLHRELEMELTTMKLFPL